MTSTPKLKAESVSEHPCVDECQQVEAQIDNECLEIPMELLDDWHPDDAIIGEHLDNAASSSDESTVTTVEHQSCHDSIIDRSIARVSALPIFFTTIRPPQ